MKTAYLFPGLNGLLRRADRNKFLELPEVHARFEEAEGVIRKRFDKEVSFLALLASSTDEIYSIQNISLAAIAICSLQVGVTDRLKKKFSPPDWVMGCSLGDLARAVFAGAYDFKHAVYNHILFTQSIDGIDKIGRNIGVLAPREKPFTPEDYDWFDSIEVDVSQLTSRFLNVGGRFREINLIESSASSRGWRVMPILNYPAHSRYILPYVERVQKESLEIETKRPQIPIFSSLSVQPLEEPTLIREEFLLSITRTIHWHRAISALASGYGVSRFINIGPCRSLSGMMKDITLADKFETIEASELV